MLLVPDFPAPMIRKLGTHPCLVTPHGFPPQGSADSGKEDEEEDEEDEEDDATAASASSVTGLTLVACTSATRFVEVEDGARSRSSRSSAPGDGRGPRMWIYKLTAEAPCRCAAVPLLQGLFLSVFLIN